MIKLYIFPLAKLSVRDYYLIKEKLYKNKTGLEV